MLNILQIDIKSLKKSFLFVIIYNIAIPIILLITSEKEMLPIPFFIVFFSVTFILGKLCSSQDSSEFRTFFKTLGFSQNSNVISKYFLMYVLVIITGLLAKWEFKWIFNTQINSIYFVGLLFGLLLYFSVYLLLYFTIGYQGAQSTLMVIFGFSILFFYLINHNPDFFNQLFHNFLSTPQLVTTSLIAIISFCASMIILLCAAKFQK